MNYIQGKKDKNCSVKKVKVVDSEAVKEVKDDEGFVVREARAEKSHEELQLVTKQWDASTGKSLDDRVEVMSIENCDSMISSFAEQIASATSEKAEYVALKADLEAL